MTPNLFLLTNKLVRPRSWFCGPSRRNSLDNDHGMSKRGDERTGCTYQFIPDHGWYLVKRPDPADRESGLCEPVVWCVPLHRWLLKTEMLERTRKAEVWDDKEISRILRVFRLDDGITWINCWHEDGTFNPGPWQRWCFDKETGKLRHMLVRDDPARRRPASTRDETGAVEDKGLRRGSEELPLATS